MRRTGLLCAAGLGLWSVVVTCGQAAPAMAMPEALRTHLKNEQFDVVTSIRGLPLGIRQDLQRMWGSSDLDIAEPGAEFQGAGATADSQLPTRRLIAAGCAPDHHCLVYYERGGPAPTWRVALFQWTPAATRFEAGGTAPGGLETVNDVRNAVVSGAVKGPTSLW